MPNQQPNQQTLPRLAETFTYRYNWIRQDRGSKWRTIKKHLSDEQLINLYQSPSAIIGVGFGKKTSHLILDIDRGSPYHPSQDPHAINTIKDILSVELGLEESIIIQSSYSEGNHLYYPLPKPVKSYYLGKVVTETLETHGYKIKGGQLEVFPNKKQGQYTQDKKKWTIYNRIRLPLQPNSGSYILDDDFNPLVGIDSEGRLKAESLEQFWWLWDKAAACQDMEKLASALQNNRQQTTSSSPQPFFSSKGKYQYKSPTIKQIEKELQEQIQRGFTGDAQTNDLLLNLGRRVRIVERIGDTALRDRLQQIVTAMPGYHQYCGHIKDIWQRCQDIARWATKMFYVQGEKKSQPLPELKTSNQQKKRDAEARILEGLVHAFSRTYQSVREFVEYMIKLVKCSPNTLYKNSHLWEERLAGLLTNKNTTSPTYQSPPHSAPDSPDNPPQMSQKIVGELIINNSSHNGSGRQQDREISPQHPNTPTPHNPEMVCNSPVSQGSSPITPPQPLKSPQMVCNSPASQGLRAFSQGESQKEEMVCNSPASQGSSTITPPNHSKAEKPLESSHSISFSDFLNAPLLRLYILCSGFSPYLQCKYLLLLFKFFLQQSKSDRPQTQSSSQEKKILNCNASNTATNYVLQPEPDFHIQKNNHATSSEAEESVTAEASEVEDNQAQTPVKEINFEDWYQQAIALGIVEDVPISWLPKMMGQYMVRVLEPDPLTGAPYTLVKWRELASKILSKNI